MILVRKVDKRYEVGGVRYEVDKRYKVGADLMADNSNLIPDTYYLKPINHVSKLF